MENLISDLALILISAGIVTLLFKRLRQPLVLGYIVAGFLAGPHMPYTPTVTDTASVQTWADLGVIFLMFTLGLEFSFKKIVKMGMGPVIAACLTMFSMMSVGSGVGHLFGWGNMNSLFLGGMLAMSSTTIIYKAFDDLGLRQKKFSGEVLSVLILEDILGILLMVVLSAVAVSRQFEGIALAGSLLKLAFFLILWFVVGVYVVPLFLRKAQRWMNRETLLVVSIGLCFLLVVMAERAGYSAAFGAFMMGSILAETIEAESIERVVSPVKDLFGAIFFVSVGMLVDPAVIARYWLPILVLCGAIVAGQAVLGSTSFLLSGQPLRTAVQCGFSMAEIGEFAFIIASLGTSLGVTDPFLYPVVVAVSIITTFCTPYLIRAARPAGEAVERLVPDRVLTRIARRSQRGAVSAEPEEHLWKSLLMALVGQVGAYLTLGIAVVTLSLGVLLPLCRGALGHWVGNGVCGLLAVLTAAPFLRAIVMRKNHSEEWKQLSRRGRFQRALLRLTLVVRFGVAVAPTYYVLNFLSPLWWPWHVAAAVVLVSLMVASKRVKFVSIRLERTFLQNLRLREVKARSEQAGEPGYAGRLNSRNIHIASLDVPECSLWAGRRLKELGFSRADGVMVAAIVRGDHRLNVPDGEAMLFPGDRLEVIGDDESLQAFGTRLDAEQFEPTARGTSLQLRRFVVREGTPFVGLTLAESGIRSAWHCMVVGVEDGEGNIEPASAARAFVEADVVWVVGEEASVRSLLKAHALPA